MGPQGNLRVGRRVGPHMFEVGVPVSSVSSKLELQLAGGLMQMIFLERTISHAWYGLWAPFSDSPARPLPPHEFTLLLRLQRRAAAAERV